VSDAPVIDAPPEPRPLGGLDGTCSGQPGKPRVLVNTHENQWRHLSNLHARQALLDMCATRGFTVASSNDPHVSNATQLAQFDVVAFAVTSSAGIDAAGKPAFEAATATEQACQLYVQNMGAELATHGSRRQPRRPLPPDGARAHRPRDRVGRAPAVMRQRHMLVADSRVRVRRLRDHLR
jgi:hypothetical protein